MTDAEFARIKKAWAEGRTIQYRASPTVAGHAQDWVDWKSQMALNLNGMAEWRVKPTIFYYRVWLRIGLPKPEIRFANWTDECREEAILEDVQGFEEFGGWLSPRMIIEIENPDAKV
jgi:hypothetical protein